MAKMLEKQSPYKVYGFLNVPFLFGSTLKCLVVFQVSHVLEEEDIEAEEQVAHV